LNRGLSATGSDVFVAAGFPYFRVNDITKEGSYIYDRTYIDPDYLTATFFEQLAGHDVLNEAGEVTGRVEGYGEKYAELLAQGKKAEAMAVVEEARNKVIKPLLSNAAASGNITMTDSEISSSAGGSLTVLATGDLNVGKTAIKTGTSTEESNSGIYTSFGGGISIYATGDVNVNESRVMTFKGGDIFTWSDKGNINAGRGSRTAISSSPPRIVEIKDASGKITGYELQFTPPKLGSGYRAVTYDPDGPEGPQQAPEAGDIYLYAPDGDIDAGEAGISGNRVVLGANAILNAKNISFMSASVGVPTGESTVSLGAISGVSSLTDSNKMIEQSTLGAAKSITRETDKIDQILAGWLDVKVISFDADQEEKKER
jgi:hypothetical protein